MRTLAYALVLALGFFAVASLAQTPSQAHTNPVAQAHMTTSKPVVRIAFDRTLHSPLSIHMPRFTDIYVMDADGTHLEQLTHDGKSHTPVWSPDGRRILFLREGKQVKDNPYDPDRDSARTDMYVMDADGNNLHPLTGDGLSRIPVWSPDGGQIAFLRGGARLASSLVLPAETHSTAEVAEIVVMEADGSNSRTVYSGQALVFGLSWAPDGKLLVTSVLPVSKGADVRAQIRAIDTAKPEQTQSFELPSLSLSRSPDGRSIAYVMRQKDKPLCPAVANADGSSPRCLTRKAVLGRPIWSPDGMQLVFTTHDYGSEEIYLINSDGSGLRRVAKMENQTCRDLSWPRHASQIAFLCSSVFGSFVRSGGDVFVLDLTAKKPKARKVLAGAGHVSFSPVVMFR